MYINVDYDPGYIDEYDESYVETYISEYVTEYVTDNVKPTMVEYDISTSTPTTDIPFGKF
jgi:hypothetical protein